MLPIAAWSVLMYGSNVGQRTVSEAEFIMLTLGLCVPLIWRRRWPRAVFVLIAVVAAVQWAAHIAALPPDLAVLIALYTVASRCGFRWGLTAAIVAEAGAIMEACQQWGLSWEQARSPAIFLTVVVAAVWVFGIYMNTRRAYLRSLEERAARLERERDTQVQVAMAAERARIARELHDVVAHNVSVIVVQADGAAYAIESDKERAKQALEAISATGRTALAEMRRLLGVLRESDDTGSYAPQPGIEQLTDLVDQIRASGMPLRFEIDGVPRELSQGLQLTVFRIVQEALTNTLKHAGTGATAHVNLHYGDDSVEVRVRDDGRGAAAADDGRGHGLVGMRERVAMYGGSALARARSGGGWEVVARLPVREAART
ncbi:sensor histidine kinase [Actinomadura alba]|uniref:histidine kinase n=2 Tax=Actinomadura alba TaxID=406431 RepID=A0ABR7LU37_9ACTN|nr:sensor histidine kinase [Actinomadura alba]